MTQVINKGGDICGSVLLFTFHVCHAVLSVHCSLVVTCRERANLLALLYVMFSCFVLFGFLVILSLSHLVSWVMCGT